MPQQWNRSSSPSNVNTVYAALARLNWGNLYPSILTVSNEELTLDDIFTRCILRKVACDWAEEHRYKNKNIHLSEAELVSGTIMANWSDHARRWEAVKAMNLEVSKALNLRYVFLNNGLRRTSSSVRSEQSSRQRT